MKRHLPSVILASVVVIGSLVACNLPVSQGQQPLTATPLPTASSTATIIPVTIAPSASPTPEFAPFCAPDVVTVPTPAGCHLPIAEPGDTFCTKKVPYNLVFMNPGSTYETLTENFRCSDAGVQDGRQMITCTGPMAASYEVKICDSACVVPSAAAGSLLCPSGYVLDSLLECCAPEAQIT